MQTLSAEGVLGVLPKARIIELGRDLEVSLSGAEAKERQIQALLKSGKLRFRELLRHLGRDELKSICRAHGLDDSGRARAALQSRILAARGGKDSAPPAALFDAREVARHLPRDGDIVLCRHRQWLVENVFRAEKDGQATRVRLICLDDDSSGRVTEVLWELELGARVHKPEAHGLGSVGFIDPPRRFAAYLHALKWNSVTSTDSELFQAPFRAGIDVEHYQLTPLMKALRLPRANLFIADDVGLGKTIEAGLVLSELMLRQQVDLTLIVCPAAVTLQWQQEMRNKFGLNFEVMTRSFMANRRKERGFGINVWSSHQRFIISHQLLRRPEYRDPLLARLQDRARKSMLILDEAHLAAPASGGRYAIDSQITHVIRDIAPKFDNRLFLSATPHNGHSNSFSALLELLDPHRFTRGVPVRNSEQLKQVMVRRLKQDLRDAGETGFPLRRLVKLGLRHEGGTWFVSERAYNPKKKGYSDVPERALGSAPPFELELAEDLTRYVELACPKKGRDRLSFVTLQKRLLSSVEAFAHTLQVHSEGKVAARALEAASDRSRQIPLQDANGDVEVYGRDEDSLEAEREEEVRSQSAALPQPSSEAKALLEKMLKAAHKARSQPDAKIRALVDWITRNQCEGVRLGARPSEPPRKNGKTKQDESLKWKERRLIIFTEYGDTKRYLLQQLTAAIAGTDREDERIMQLHGGMGDDKRAEVQKAFNDAMDEHPVRILIATDAAREGINLQGQCADIVHFDVPWNPARLEQRNGRIDRKLQPSDVVRCHYFAYAQRGEDPVLVKLVEKTETIARELGSIAAVVMDRVAEELESEGIRKSTPKAFDEWTAARVPSSTETELESSRARLDELSDETQRAGEHYNKSKEKLEFDAGLLKDAIDEGLALAGAAPLAEVGTKKSPQYRVPAELGDSWQVTLDSLRPVRKRDQPFFEWRKEALRPVTFKPVKALNDKVVQLHLQHPLVQRVMSRFLAQGFSMSDLSRVTVVRNEHDALVRVIAFGRLSLFGSKAARLHDELISVAARWVDTKPQPLKPFAEAGDAKAVAMLERILKESPELDDIPAAIRERVQSHASDLFGQLWKSIREEADARGVEAIKKLKARGRAESDALKGLLKEQHDAITKELKKSRQLTLAEQEALNQEQARREQEQWDAERKHMRTRLSTLEEDLKTEPAEVQKLYDVALHRLQPVGLVVLWPATRMGGR